MNKYKIIKYKCFNIIVKVINIILSKQLIIKFKQNIKILNKFQQSNI